ncbi:hypothetical protein [Nocardioides yefusunii]|uniref:Uncharacterized protein n=1 Tax=Nocardioides yefusunii TaxID=2500546 RepID=A0ABW1R015_9ACTN|nr:hypothetical protein [Nocardioides yefusunii]
MMRRSTTLATALVALVSSALTISAAPAQADDVVQWYAWTNQSGDNTWSNPKNWNVGDLSSPDAEIVVPTIAPGAGSASQDAVRIDASRLSGPTARVRVDAAAPPQIDRLVTVGDVTLSGGSIVVEEVELTGNGEDEGETPAQVRVSTQLLAPSDAVTGRTVIRSVEGEGTLTLTKSALTTYTHLINKGSFSGLVLQEACPWTETDLEDEYTHLESDTSGSSVLVLDGTQPTYDCDGSTAPVVEAPRAVKAAAGDSGITISFEAPVNEPTDSSVIRDYLVTRYTDVDDDGLPVAATGVELAVVSVDGSVVSGSGQPLVLAPDKAPKRYEVTDSAKIVLGSVAEPILFDPLASYYYTVRTRTATEQSAESAPVNAEIVEDGKVEVSVSTRATPRPGLTVPIDARVVNSGKERFGTVDVTVALPANSFQTLPVSEDLLPSDGSTDRGWTCTTAVIPDQYTLVNCSNPAKLNAGRAYPLLSLHVDVPKDAALTTFDVNYSATTTRDVDGVTTPMPLSSQVPIGFEVLEPHRAHLSAEVGVPGQLPALDEGGKTAWEPVTVRVANDGKAETTGPVTVTVPLAFPHEKSAGAVVAGPGAVAWNAQEDVKDPTPGWTCSAALSDAEQSVTCVTDAAVLAGSATPDLLLPLAAVPVAEGTAPYDLAVQVESTDAFGPVAAPARASVKLPVLSPALLLPNAEKQDVAEWTPEGALVDMASTTNVTLPEEGRTAALSESAVLTLGATNSGQVAFSGALTFVETVPMASEVRLVETGGWSCDRDATTVTCTDDDVEVKAGGTVTGPTLVVSPVSTAPVMPASAFAGSLHTISVATGQSATHSTPITTDLSTPAGQAIPPLSTQGTLESAPLTPGFHTEATFSLKGHPTFGDVDAGVLAFLVPSQVTLDDDADKPAITMTGFADDAPQPVCESYGDTFPGGHEGVVLCDFDQVIPSGSQGDASVGITVGDNVAGALQFPIGLLDVAGDTPAERFIAAWDVLRARGASALQSSSVLSAESVLIAPAAGEDQEVEASTPDEDGLPNPTQVNLDASASVSIGRPFTYTWTQVAGPAVTWLDTDGKATDEKPKSATGERPSFLAPGVSSPTALTFSLLAKDSQGPATGTDTVNVVVNPAAPSAPVINQITLLDAEGARELNALKTPEAGTELTLAVRYNDADSDLVTVTPKVAVPAELANLPFSELSNAKTGMTGRATYRFVWPRDVQRLALSVQASDGTVDTSGTSSGTRADFAIGPDASTLGISVAGPVETVSPGASVDLTVDLVNDTFEGASTQLTWSQVSRTQSSSARGTLTPDEDGRTAVLTVPATARPGDEITVRTHARRGSGSASATATDTTTVTVGAPDPIAIGDFSLEGASGQDDEFVEGDAATFAVEISGGVAPYETEWSTIIGDTEIEAVTDDEGEGNVSLVRATTAELPVGVAAFQLDVTDAIGQTSGQVVEFTVGEYVEPEPDSPACATDGPLGMVLTMARSFVETGVDVTNHVVVTYGDAVVDFGEAGALLSGLPDKVVCNDELVIGFTDAGMTYRGIGLTGLKGSLSTEGITLDEGTVALPSAWNLGSVTLAEVKISFEDYAVTGTLSAADLPLLSDTGLDLSPVTTTLTLREDALLMQASVSQVEGSGQAGVTGAYCWPDSEGCGDIPGLIKDAEETAEDEGSEEKNDEDDDLSGDLVPGELFVHVSAEDFEAFDAAFGGTGLLRHTTGRTTGSVSLELSDGEVELGTDAVVIDGASLEWTPKELGFELSGVVASKAAISIEGSFEDKHNWSATVTGGLAEDWEAAPGLKFTKYDAEAKTGASVTGTIASSTEEDAEEDADAAPAAAPAKDVDAKDDDAKDDEKKDCAPSPKEDDEKKDADAKDGTKDDCEEDEVEATLSMSLALAYEGRWKVGAMSVERLGVQMGLRAAAPVVCGLDEDTVVDDVYFAVDGVANVKTGSTAVDIGAEFCVVPGTSWRAVTTASAPSLTPVQGLTLTSVQLAAQHTAKPKTTSISLAASGSVVGVRGAAVVAVDADAEGTDLAASVTVNLGDITGALSGTGRVIYTSKPIADLGSSVLNAGLGGVAKDAASCADRTSNPTVNGMKVPAGFTAIGQFSLGQDACEFLSKKLDFPAATNVVATVSLSGTTRTVELALSAGKNGVKIFEKSDGTRLQLNTASLRLATDGSLSILGASSLFMPRPDEVGGKNLARLDATAGLSIRLAGVPSVTAALTVDGDNWTNALGIEGLTLSRAAIQVGVVFSAIPTPSVGIAATATKLPTQWKNALGVVADEKVSFALNISVDSPIVSLTLGEQDGRTFMKPVPGLPDALQIDAAQLTIAPFGGKIGEVVFPAGFTVSFDTQVLGVGVHFNAALDMATPSFEADANVGAFSVGPVALDETTVHLSVAPKELKFTFTGGFTINATPGSNASTSATRVTAKVDVEALASGSFNLAFSAAGRNIPLGTVATIENLALNASVKLAKGTDAARNGFSLDGSGQIKVLDKRFVLGGSVVYSSGSLQSLDAVAASDPFSLGGLEVTGNGCSPTALKSLPVSLTSGPDKITFPATGPCLQVGVHPGTTTPVMIAISAKVAVTGLSVELDGSVDATGVAINTAQVQLTDQATATIHNSRLYFSPTNTFGGATITSPVTGRSHPVQNGDFRLQGAAAVKLAGFVEGDLQVDVGRIGAASDVWAKGTLAVGLLQSASSPIHADLKLDGNFAKTGNTYDWAMAGKSDLILGGTRSGNGWVNGYRVASASFSLKPSGFTAAGTLDAGIVQADVNADLAWSNGFSFTVQGRGRMTLLGTGVDAAVLVTNRSTQGAGVIVASADVNANIGQFVNARVSGTFTTTGATCLSGRGSLNVPVGAGAPNLADVAASVCTTGVPNQAAGFKANASAFNGTINLGVQITDASGFHVYGTASLPHRSIGGIECWAWGRICGGAEGALNGTVMLSISSQPRSFSAGGQNWNVGSGIAVAGVANAYLKVCVAGCGSIHMGASISYNPTRFCATAFGEGICYTPPASLSWA